jgi:hypothetical protein
MSAKKGSLWREGLFVSGGRNAERGKIALRVQDPTARHEEASNDSQLSCVLLAVVFALIFIRPLLRWHSYAAGFDSGEFDDVVGPRDHQELIA